MKMRTFIKLKTPSKSIRGTFHARYISEREREPGREEPESRPLFTHDRDGLKYKAADRYLAGGERPNARSNEIQHIIIAFNNHDARELQKLEIAPEPQAPSDARGRETESSNPEHSDESSNLEHSPAADRKRARREELVAIHTAQVAHDRPYAEAVRRMMRNLEESSGLSHLRYVIAVHRHTDKTHVHLLLRRECTVTKTGEKTNLHRLPETFLNGRDEQGKAKGGLLDMAPPDALDPMTPRRQRASRTESASAPLTRSDQQIEDRVQQVVPEDPPYHKTPATATTRRDDAGPKSMPQKPRPRFTTGRPAQTVAS